MFTQLRSALTCSLPRSIRLGALSALAPLALVGVITAQNDVVFQDATFTPGDWTVSTLSSVNGGSHSEAQLLSGGNTGSYRQMVHTMPAPPILGSYSQVVVRHEFTAGTYTPGSQGAIANIDFRFDQKVISLYPSASAAGSGVGSYFVLLQNGTTYYPYVAGSFVNADFFYPNNWTTFSRSGFSAANFRSSPGLTSPDFSAAGAPITFGVQRSSSNVASVSRYLTSKTHGLDNFRVTVHSLPNLDSDNDGLLDTSEISVHGTNPYDADSDDDGLFDGAEVVRTTDPLDPDTDDDGLVDGNEVTLGTDPLDADSDDDGLLDADEVARTTSPTDPDTDDDGLNDGDEIGRLTDPLDADSDDDGLVDGDEVSRATDPLDADTDGDGMTDGEEVALAAFGDCPSPLLTDSDGDGLGDNLEVVVMLDPCDSDSDNDGLMDGLESSYGTDPAIADTDGDGLLDGTEVDISSGGTCPNPIEADSDEDGVLDGIEVAVGMMPCNPDSDGDTVSDGIDPTPLVPGVPGAWIEDELRDQVAVVLALQLPSIAAPNGNAAAGRRTSMANRFGGAANLVAAGNYSLAIAELNSLLEKIDSQSPPPDWMVESPAKWALADEVRLYIFLLELM